MNPGSRSRRRCAVRSPTRPVHRSRVRPWPSSGWTTRASTPSPPRPRPTARTRSGPGRGDVPAQGRPGSRQRAEHDVLAGGRGRRRGDTDHPAGGAGAGGRRRDAAARPGDRGHGSSCRAGWTGRGSAWPSTRSSREGRRWSSARRRRRPTARTGSPTSPPAPTWCTSSPYGGDGPILPEYYRDAVVEEDAVPVTVSAGTVVTGIDLTPAGAGRITGVVTAVRRLPSSGVEVTLVPRSGQVADLGVRDDRLGRLVLDRSAAPGGVRGEAHLAGRLRAVLPGARRHDARPARGELGAGQGSRRGRLPLRAPARRGPVLRTCAAGEPESPAGAARPPCPSCDGEMSDVTRR